MIRSDTMRHSYVFDKTRLCLFLGDKLDDFVEYFYFRWNNFIFSGNLWKNIWFLGIMVAIEAKGKRIGEV